MQADSCDRSKRQYSGFVDCAKQLYKEGGIKRFFKGKQSMQMKQRA